jgi:hypothetical protein
MEGKTLKYDRIHNYKIYNNRSSDDCFLYNRGGEFISLETKSAIPARRKIEIGRNKH